MTNLRELLAKAKPLPWALKDGAVCENAEEELMLTVINALPGLLDKVERYESALRKIQLASACTYSCNVADKALEGAGHADG